MARMIPPTIGSNVPSPGERDLFLRLKEDPGCSEWIVLHSLDIANHVKQVQGEADFVVIVPKQGILCIEVKAHHQIRFAEGEWFFGVEQKLGKSPFRQAATAMHSLREYVIKKRPDLSGLLFWSAVIFTHTAFLASSVEWHPWQVIDSVKYRSRPISSLLLAILHNAHGQLRNHSPKWYKAAPEHPTVEECEAITQILRPNFEILESPRERLGSLVKEVRQFTEEQFVALEAMESNRRVVFTGPAGTGKTVLALESARRAKNLGQRVLLLSFNRLLGSYLARECGELQGAEINNLHSHMRKVADLPVPADAADSFWQDDLPQRAIDQLLMDSSMNNVYDLLILDEAQDMLRDNYLDFLDLSLKGGLAAGSWRFFGDFEKQSIYGSANLPLDSFLANRSGNAARYNLRINCRNTAQIATLAELISGLDPGYKKIMRSGDGVEPRMLSYGTPEAQSRLLIAELENVYQQGFKAEEIVILSMRKNSEAAASRVVANKWEQRLKPLEQAAKGDIGYGTIRSFKGLEAPAVILTDIDKVRDDESASVLYVGLTRALHRLSILLNKTAQKDVLDIITGGG